MITDVRVTRIGGPLATSAANARAEWKERVGLLLALRDGDGRVGLGEASPLPRYSPDTIDACEATLRALPADRLPLRDEEEPIEEWLDKAAKLVDPNAPAARFALETALLDLEARRRNVSISRLLAGDAATRAIPLAALLPGDDAERVVEGAKQALARGLRTVKWKIGRAGRFREELGVVRALRDAVGAGTAIRLDANGAWDLIEADEKLAELAPFAPEFVEQPVVPYLLLKLGPAPVTVAADETLAFPGALERLNLVPSCRVLVLKPMVLGGFAPVLRMMRIARARRYGVVVTHLFDGPVALAAAAELALALRPEPLACGLDRHAGLAAWPPATVPQVGARAVVPSGRPGLGVDPSEVAP